MAFPRRGEIWLAQLPDDPKGRPVLILSIDALNRHAHDLTIVPLTTIHHAQFPMRVEVPKAEGGLRRQSWARCDQVTTINKQRLLRGAFRRALPRERMEAIERGVRMALRL